MTRTPDGALPWFAGAVVRVVLSSADTDGALSVVTIEADAGYAAAPHRHDREDELFYVVTGAIVAEVDGEPRRLRAGEAVLLRRGVVHAYRVESDASRILNVCTPGGLDGFFLEAARRVGSGEEPEAFLRPLGLRYGVSYL